MGLFSKKPPCPVCGGKIPLILPSKIEGEYICNACCGKIDIESDIESRLTMQDFREYLAFYDQNQALKDKFTISEHIDFGLWSTKIIFDYENKLFCMSKNPDKTVFEGAQLKSFTVKEDYTPLFEGSAAGMLRYESTAPERAMAVAPQINRFLMNRQLSRTLDKLDDGKVNGSSSAPLFSAPAPFKAFNIELHVEHPYWNVIAFDISGPTFDTTHPSVDSYLRDYQRSVEEIEKLASAFRTVAFPNAAGQWAGAGATHYTQPAYPAHSAAAAPVDAIEEIKKYKSLMEEGVISREEFDAKKRQLLGI